MGHNAQRRREEKKQQRVAKGFRMPALDMKMIRVSLPGPVWRDFVKMVKELNTAAKEASPDAVEMIPTQQIYLLMIGALVQYQKAAREKEEKSRLVQPVGGSLLTQLEKFEKEHPGETPRIKMEGEGGKIPQAPTHPGSPLII